MPHGRMPKNGLLKVAIFLVLAALIVGAEAIGRGDGAAVRKKPPLRSGAGPAPLSYPAFSGSTGSSGRFKAVRIVTASCGNRHDLLSRVTPSSRPPYLAFHL